MSQYPNLFDNEHSLYTVQDSLQVTLDRDYHPGDGAVWVESTDGFPSSGIITLVDQCSRPKERAVALKYKAKSKDAFLGIEPTDDTNVSYKPKKLTKVTMQLRAEHHNSIVDAIIAIENFLGTHRDESKEPSVGSILGRLNFLKSLVYSPKAWFEVDKTVGLVPLTVTFNCSSGNNVGIVTYEWDFGDGNTTSTLEPNVQHTYTFAGVYSVSLRVNNDYGEDTISINKLIRARIEAPEDAVITFDPQPGQILTPGEPDGGPYEVPPVLRTPVNQLVVVKVQEESPHEMYTAAGEPLDHVTGKPIDPITSYTWDMGDDLPHGNSAITRAAYSFGGLHDLILRVDTECGAYRITTYENCLDAVEKTNMWLWTFTDKTNVRAHEFGVNSETFKVRKTAPLTIQRNESFLDDAPNSEQQKREFRRNCGFAPRGSSPSGLHGSNYLFWATGRSAAMPSSVEQINFVEYQPFTDVYMSVEEGISRPWNWASLISPEYVYFFLGVPLRVPSGMSPTNQAFTQFHLGTANITEEGVEGYNYVNGAHEVAHHPAYFGNDGKAIHGNFAVYRTAWRGMTGYLLRNSDVGDQFALRNFYKTDGTMSMPFLSLVKLPDLPGGRKEGQLANLSSGIYLFNNSGVALAYKEETGTWETTGGGNPGLFKSLQDAKTVGYEKEENTLLVATDGDRKAFLSFDYSCNAFVKFNEADFTFTTLGARPEGEQWQMGVF